MKKAAVRKFMPFRADSIAVSMPDTPATIGRIVHYTPGKKLPQPWNQRFWEAAQPAILIWSKRRGASCGWTPCPVPLILTR